MRGFPIQRYLLFLKSPNGICCCRKFPYPFQKQRAAAGSAQEGGGSSYRLLGARWEHLWCLWLPFFFFFSSLGPSIIFMSLYNVKSLKCIFCFSFSTGYCSNIKNQWLIMWLPVLGNKSDVNRFFKTKKNGKRMHITVIHCHWFVY